MSRRLIASIDLYEEVDSGNVAADTTIADGTWLSTGPWYTRRACLDDVACRINDHLSGARTAPQQTSDGAEP